MATDPASHGLRALLPRLERMRFSRGRTIIFRGEMLASLYLIEKGLAQAEYETGLGPVTLTLGPGDFLGEAGLLEGRCSDARVLAASGHTVVAAVPCAQLRALMAENSALRHYLLEKTAERRASLGAALLGWTAFKPGIASAAAWPRLS
jgi:CRP-like cAMP-binding protein